MPDAIDRVAKAIWEATHPNPPGWAAWEDASGFGPTEQERLATYRQARAAIAELSKITDPESSSPSPQVQE